MRLMDSPSRRLEALVINPITVPDVSDCSSFFAFFRLENTVVLT